MKCSLRSRRKNLHTDTCEAKERSAIKIKCEDELIPDLDDISDGEYEDSLFPQEKPFPRFIRGAKPPLKWNGDVSASISNDYSLTWSEIWLIFHKDYIKWKHVDVARIAAKNQIPTEARARGCHKSTLLDCANQFCDQGLLVYVKPSDSPYGSFTSYVPTEMFLSLLPASIPKEKKYVDSGPVVESPKYAVQVISGPKNVKWTIMDVTTNTEYTVSLSDIMESPLPVALAIGKALVSYDAL